MDKYCCIDEKSYLSWLITKKGYTKKQFAEFLGMTKEDLIIELNKKQSNFNFYQLDKICELLQMEFNQIFKSNSK